MVAMVIAHCCNEQTFLVCLREALLFFVDDLLEVPHGRKAGYEQARRREALESPRLVLWPEKLRLGRADAAEVFDARLERLPSVPVCSGCAPEQMIGAAVTPASRGELTAGDPDMTTDELTDAVLQVHGQSQAASVRAFHGPY